MIRYNKRDLEDIWDKMNLLHEFISRYEHALYLIAANERPDGTYNRSREDCQELSEQVLGYVNDMRKHDRSGY